MAQVDIFYINDNQIGHNSCLILEIFYIRKILILNSVHYTPVISRFISHHWFNMLTKFQHSSTFTD